MKHLTRLFTEHPASVGESYTGHMRSALRYAGLLTCCAVAAAVHSVLPFLFQSTASDLLFKIHAEMSARRNAAAGQPRTPVQTRAGEAGAA